MQTATVTCTHQWAIKQIKCGFIPQIIQCKYCKKVLQLLD